MSARTIKCEACGWPYETTSRKTKYCKVCQLLRQIKWLGTRETTCVIEPEHTFVNLTNQREAPVCGAHDLMPGPHDVQGQCKLCGEFSDKLVHKDVSICRTCITKPENRTTVLSRLKQKQAWQHEHAKDGVRAEV